MFRFTTIAFAYLSLVPSSLAQYQRFVTRPDDHAVAIDIISNPTPEALAPGYFFLTPLNNVGPDLGPHIVGNNGNLIWYGNSTVHARANGATVCNYAGATTLCYNDGLVPEQGGHSTGANRFFSTSYSEIASLGALNGLRGPDNHEENTPDGSYVLRTVFQPRQVDLTGYGVKNGWIEDGCFQEVRIPAGSVSFQWCAFERGVALAETAVYMKQSGNVTNPIAGYGTQNAPWDLYHINSVAKDAGTGDYAVSLRHCNLIVRVCGTNSSSAECANKPAGAIAWRLGGKRNDFEGNMDFTFSGQHMIRFHNGYLGNNENSTLSLFNDASDGVSTSANTSSGLVFTVSVTPSTPTTPATHIAKLLANYTLHPPYSLLSASQGSLQLLPNWNALIGWGNRPYYSEFSRNGTFLYHASFGKGLPNMQNYRAFKYPWHGDPQARPDVVAYASGCNGSVYAYASWNGATDVRSWRVRGGATNGSTGADASTGAGSTWRVLANVDAEGFETVMLLPEGAAAARYVRAEALGAGGRVIGVSEVVETFVPGAGVGQENGCSAMGCRAGTDYTSLGAGNVVGTC